MLEENEIIRLNTLLRQAISDYQCLTTDEVKNKLNVFSSAKNLNSVIFYKMINCSENKEEIKRLLEKCHCIVKTVNLEWNNRLKESMSLKVFKYTDLVNEDWENSSLRKYFEDNLFVFVVFQKTYSGSTLKDVKVWKMPHSILDGGVKDVWEKTKQLVSEGKIVNYVDSRNRFITFFPTSSETKFIHVRPHAQNSNDTLPLPVKDKYTGKDSFTKHSFWINSNLIRRIVVEGKYYE